jgi:hypothetical protein
MRTSSTGGCSAFTRRSPWVLQGVYANLSPGFSTSVRDPGFVPSATSRRRKRGFSIAESELGLSANVDDKFYGN